MRLVALGAAGVVAGGIMGTAVPALAWWTGTGSATVQASATSLAVPGLEVAVSEQGEATITVTPPDRDPLPTRYVVSRDDKVVCASEEEDLTSPYVCREAGLSLEADVTYAVEARFEQWSRTVSATGAVPATDISTVRVSGVALGDAQSAATLAGGDTMTVTYSGAVDPASVCPGWDGEVPATVTLRAAAQADATVVSFSGGQDACGGSVAVGSLTLPTGGHDIRNSTPLDFVGTSVSLDESHRALTVTVGSTVDELVWHVPAQNGEGARATFDPAPVRDALGNETAVEHVDAVTGTF